MKIFLKPCEQCDFSDVGRLSRSWWMRFIPKLRFYRCARCRKNFMAPKKLVEERQWMTTTLKNFRVPSRPSPLDKRAP